MFDTKHIGRAEVLDGFNAFTIEIPAQRSWFKIIFLCVWLCGWLAGELFAVFTLFNSPEDGFTIVFKGEEDYILFYSCRSYDVL